ncbi:MAG TPA: cell division protein FtsQ/DivIB, partial [Pseudoxanthomonas sp.]|nr:cell division protein FtsQ/DivIB [Pseudoxanthomonas sp.]
LPRLGGPDSQVQDVVTLYNEARLLFAPLGLRVEGLAMDRRGSWSLILDSGAHIVVGRADARPRLARFARLLPQLLASNPQPLQRADLRYTNGFALTWKDAATEAGGSEAAQPAQTPPVAAEARRHVGTHAVSMRTLGSRPGPPPRPVLRDFRLQPISGFTT